MRAAGSGHVLGPSSPASAHDLLPLVEALRTEDAIGGTVAVAAMAGAGYPGTMLGPMGCVRQ